MRNARSTIFAVFTLLCLYGCCNTSGSPIFENQNNCVGGNDTLIEDLIFKAQFDQAIIVAENAIEQIKNYSIEKLLLLLKLSEIYIYKNNPDKASKILHEVALEKNARGITNNHLEFLYSLEMGMMLRESGRNGEAGKWLNKSESIVRKIGQPSHLDVSKLYILLGRHSYETRDSILAVSYFKKSIKVLSGNSVQVNISRINTYSYLQLAYLLSGNFKEARQVETKADSAYQSITIKNHPSLINYYLLLALMNLNYSLNSNKAENALHFASEILNKYYDRAHSYYGLLYCYRGQLAYQEHDSEKALGYLKQAESYLVKNQDLSPYMNLLYFDLANTYYFYKNDYHKALWNYQKVIENNNPWLKRAYLNSLVLSGYCYLELGDTAKAIACVKSGIKSAETRTHLAESDKIYIYRCLAGLYLNIGKEELAHRYFQKAYEKARNQAGDWYLATDIITNLANYHRDRGEYQTALDLYQTAIDKAFSDSSVFDAGSQFCDEIELIEILNNKGYALLQIYRNKDKNYLQLKDALLCQKTAIRLIEKRLGYLDNESSEYNWLALLQTTFNNAVLYATMLYNETHDNAYADEGFRFSEKSRMMTILISSRNKNIQKYSGVPDSLIQREIRVHDEILNLQNQLIQCERVDKNSIEHRLISGKLARIQLENDQLKAIFESRYKRYFDLKYNMKVISLLQLRDNLTDNQLLLEYQLLENDLIIYAITRDHFTVKLIPDENHKRQLIQKFYHNISENPSLKDPARTFKDFSETSYLLYAWLIGPIKEEIANKQLIIIPHNEINLIPFELLISDLPSSDNPGDYTILSYLIKKCPVSYGYSGTLLFEDTKLRPGKAAAFFIPDYSGRNNYGQKQLPYLKGTQTEVYSARDLVGGDVFSDSQANETQFKHVAGNYKILHIAAHTVMDDEIPTLSSLEFSRGRDTLNDGVLYSYELYQLQLNAQLIVLSGCNTGMGLLKQGEGLMSLSRSFFYSGARSVAFTLWPQADQSGAKIMIGFYKGIKKKKRLENALQSAKLDYLINADPAKSHPYYWGGYLIVGKTDPVILNYYVPKITLILIFLCVSVGGLTYRKLRS